MTTAQNAAASIIATMTANVQALEALAQSLEGQDLGAVYVLANQGVYIKTEGGKVSACGLTGATRYTLAEARKLAPTIKNGNNVSPVPVTLGAALAEALTDSREMLEVITARAASL